MTVHKEKKKVYGPQDHTFIICAYQESPYLEKCIRSCLGQSIPGKTAMATSTPNAHIDRLAEKYGIPLFVRTIEKQEKNFAEGGAAYTAAAGIRQEGVIEKGIAADWNYAVRCAKTPLVTLAHQDDLYHPRYRERMLRALNACRHPLIGFTDYCELREEKIIASNRLLRIKRLMLLPLRLPGSSGIIFIRRRILSFGSAICCPSVTLVKENLSEPVFENNMKSNIDWQAWEQISKQQGAFAYIPKPSMLHRIHADSETSRMIRSDSRREEDMIVFRKFWPEPAVRLLEWFYRKAEDSNTEE